MTLSKIPTGAQVWKPSATPFDFAYNRIGTVVREEIDGELRTGIRWDGSPRCFQYPSDTEVVLISQSSVVRPN